MNIELGSSYTDQLDQKYMADKSAAQKRLREAMDDLREASEFEATLRTPEWQPFSKMIHALIKKADREYHELRDFHDPRTQVKAERLSEHILTLTQILAIPVDRVSNIERLRRQVLKIKSDIFKKFGVNDA